MTTLPAPSPSALAHSEKLLARIRKEIDAAGGCISFAHFMELALYAPGLGYYSAGTQKFGRAGDFVTAPEISPLFAKCLARQFQQILTAVNESHILELGAGSGAFAKELLLELERLGVLPGHYFILEVSAELRARQLEKFTAECPQFLTRIVWLDSLPQTPFSGIIFANEVLDAMPVQRFRWNKGEIKEHYVGWENNQLVWRYQAPSLALQQRIDSILQECHLPDSYCSELSLVQPAWINSLAQVLQRGAIFLVDYGYGRREYYHPERQDGTFMCFYQHHKHTDPLILIGLQDMTAHVDFTAIAESADQAGLCVAGFTSQAAFLLACGLLDIPQCNTPSEAKKYINNQAIKTLTLPGQMGEIVKVMALTKNWDASLLGFSLQDRRRDL